MVVVAKLQPGVLGHAAGQVQVVREHLPRRSGASHLTGGEVDPEERVHDVGRPQNVGVGEQGAPNGRVEWLRNEDVAGRRHDVIGVQHRLELCGGPADKTRVLDPRVADRMERGDRALEVDGELVTEREQLDADLVERDAVLVLSPALRGERWRDQRGGAADSGDGGSGGHPAQEVTAVYERDLVFRAEVVFLIGVHAR